MRRIRRVAHDFFGVGARAFVPGRLGSRARAEVASKTRGLSGGKALVSDFLGPPKTNTDAVLALALSVVPGGKAATAAKGGSTVVLKSALKIGRRAGGAARKAASRARSKLSNIRKGAAAKRVQPKPRKAAKVKAAVAGGAAVAAVSGGVAARQVAKSKAVRTAAKVTVVGGGIGAGAYLAGKGIGGGLRSVGDGANAGGKGVGAGTLGALPLLALVALAAWFFLGRKG